MVVAQHEFKADLELSQRIAAESWWETVYRQAFPDFLSMGAPVTDLGMQRQGIDRVITLSGGAQIYIDEKVRGPKYNDVWLETVSVDTTGAPGWVLKPLHCDYLAYAFTGTKICYMFPFQQVRRAWTMYGEKWLRQYPPRPAFNDGYKTWGTVVFLGPFLQALTDAMWTTWAADDGLPW